MAYNPNNPNGQATMANSQPVTISNNQTAITDIIATGSITTVNLNPGLAATSGSAVVLSLSGQGAASIQIAGTWVATLQFEATDDGTNWLPINGVFAGTSTPGSTITANGLVRLTPGGLAQMRIVATAFTSGTAVITIRASIATGGTFLNQSLPVGTNLIGKVGIDQTTPGTTNGIQINAALPAGTNTIGTVNLGTDPDTIATGTITTTDIVVAAPAGDGVYKTGTSTSGSYVFVLCPGGDTAWNVGITGLTSGTLYFEVSLDSTNGIDGQWINVNGRQTGVVNTVLSYFSTTNGMYRGNTSGVKYFRVRSVGALTGTPAITIRLSAGTGAIFLNASVPTGSNVIGKTSIDQTTDGTTNLVRLGAETTKVIGTINLSAAQTLATVTTVSAVTAITNALPTGANTIGAVTNANLDVALSTRLKPADTLAAVTLISDIRQATAANLNMTATPIAITKGTQGATGFTTQDLKDAGRSSIMVTASIASTATTETLITLTISKALAATTTGSSNTITTGKKFRIQAIVASARNSTGTVTSNVTIKLRAAIAGATTTASPLQLQSTINLPASAASTLFPDILIPDGFEIDSNSATNTWGLTITHPQWVTGTQAVTFDISLIGYEY